MLMIYALQTALPLALILWIAIVPPRSVVGFWLLVLAGALMIFASARLGIWIFSPWWAPIALALLFAGAVGFLVFRSPTRTIWPTGPVGWVSVAVFSVLAVFSAAQVYPVLQARQVPKGPALDLAWPLGPGRYLVVNGGAQTALNAHAAFLDQTVSSHVPYQGIGYAVDIIAVDAWGLRADGVMPADPSRYVIFGTPVLAPCAGTVMAAVDGVTDMLVPQADRANMSGNHVILRCDGRDVLLGHFRNGSLLVRVGDGLTVGQQIAEVGNSGNTSEPHLHIHAQQPGTPDAPYAAAPVPILLEDRYLLRNDRVTTRDGP